MNLESNQPPKKTNLQMIEDDLDFDFKPITSGLGFHHTKTTEVKPSFAKDSTPSVKPMQQPTAVQQVYQNDLAAFYNSAVQQEKIIQKNEMKDESIVRMATTSQRVTAYLLDLGLILSCLGIVLTVMARLIGEDLMSVWNLYPGEITPLVLSLFVGFYLIYFSIFEKTSSSTLGKNIMEISVVNLDNKSMSMTGLMLRSTIGLLNFLALGLFSYFDLQNKITDSKVIRKK